MVAIMHGNVLPTCDLCGKPPLLPFRRLIEITNENVEAWTQRVLSLPSMRTICSKCCQNLLLVGSLLLEWKGKVRVKNSFCGSGVERKDLSHDFEEENGYDETDYGEEEAEEDSEDVKPFVKQVSPVATKNQNPFPHSLGNPQTVKTVTRVEHDMAEKDADKINKQIEGLRISLKNLVVSGKECLI